MWVMGQMNLGWMRSHTHNQILPTLPNTHYQSKVVFDSWFLRWLFGWFYLFNLLVGDVLIFRAHLTPHCSVESRVLECFLHTLAWFYLALVSTVFWGNFRYFWDFKVFYMAYETSMLWSKIRNAYGTLSKQSKSQPRALQSSRTFRTFKGTFWHEIQAIRPPIRSNGGLLNEWSCYVIVLA